MLNMRAAELCPYYMGRLFCPISDQLPVPVVTMHYGVIYGARSNDERERGGEPTVKKFNVNKTSIYKIN